jgi:hypothetical protein
MSGVWRISLSVPQLIANSIFVSTEIREEQISPGKRTFDQQTSLVGKTEVVSNYDKSLAQCLGFCPMTLPHSGAGLVIPWFNSRCNCINWRNSSMLD